MSDDRTPVTGPIPIYVRTLPAGVVLDMEALTRLVVGDVINELLNAEDTTAWDLLHEAAEPVGQEQFSTELLEQHLAERASSRIPLYGPAALELTRKLRAAAAPKAVPPQREAGAA
ncbi:hypothetical protein STAN_1822 [Streptomyces sp. CBMAI 2042]|uniref:hypothetical protein n=1 Tax=Streptomyces sp. CBMAI 2042 TaxID=2305222 RepID=UPI000F117001|nr:hypothetical protein [Streptomyces sp. CBMAI 2042]RLV66301.1 hypothetical protein STAN_1822 [Streptomyces sp. CBMAI 2042]